MDCAPWLVAAGATAVAAVTDLRSRTIPNWLTYPALAAGLALGACPDGIGTRGSLLGLLLGFLPAFGFFAVGRLGGGDVKLLGAVGALIGFPSMLDVLILTLLFGTLLAACTLLAHVAASSERYFARGQASEQTASEPRHLPLGVAIALATLVVPFAQQTLPSFLLGAAV